MAKIQKIDGGKGTKRLSARHIHAELREDILSLELAPGEVIDENGLAERFAVSRSPIREALIRLETDGLIRMTPNKGTIVMPLHLEDFPQFIDALDTIQRAVTHLAALQRTDEDLETITAENEKFKSAVLEHNVVKMIDTNQAFHLAIADAAHNRHFEFMYRRLLDEGRRILRIYYRSYDDSPPQDRVSAHDKIIAAIRERDARKAEQLAHDHASQLSERFVSYLTTRRTAGITARFNDPL